MFTDATSSKLRELTVSFASVANPVDATANGYNDNFASYSRVIAAVLADPNIDQVIARSPRGSAAPAWSRAFVEITRATDKPVILNWPTSPDDLPDVLKFLEEHDVPCIPAPGRTVHALAALTEFAQKKRAFEGRPPAAPRMVAKQALALPAVGGTLGEHRSKQALAAYGIPVVKEVLLSAEDVANLKAAPLPFPLAVKIESADIPHKTEAGVVRLNVRTLDELKSAARDVLAAAKNYNAKTRIDGVLVQEMAGGLEVIAGAVNDRFFGPVIVFGLGGIYTELLKDVTRRFAPFDVTGAKEMIGEIKGAALLRGFRGQPALDVDALADALSRLSWLITDHADRIAEIDINPLFVRPAGQGVVAADALVVLKS
jgi:acetyltransferase